MIAAVSSAAFAFFCLSQRNPVVSSFWLGYNSHKDRASTEYSEGTDLTYDYDLAKEYAKYMIEQISGK